MILSDVTKFFTVYLLILLAFSAASYVLVVNFHVQEGAIMTSGDGEDMGFGHYVVR
jgi:hypothetical protein